MSVVHLSRKIYFSSAHRYHNPNWSEEKNAKVFGPCNNPYGHGHNYELEVTISGPVDPDTGMVINLSDLDKILKQEIMEPLDHRHLNHEVAHFQTNVPTTEEIAIYCWNQIQRALPAGTNLKKVCLYENPELFVEYYGETLDL